MVFQCYEMVKLTVWLWIILTTFLCSMFHFSVFYIFFYFQAYLFKKISVKLLYSKDDLILALSVRFLWELKNNKQWISIIHIAWSVVSLQKFHAFQVTFPSKCTLPKKGGGCEGVLKAKQTWGLRSLAVYSLNTTGFSCPCSNLRGSQLVTI